MINKGENIKKKHISRILLPDDDYRQVNISDKRFYKRREHYYPSITYILSYLPKGKHFEDWLKQMGMSADFIAQKAASDGTQVHQLIEDYLNLPEGHELNWLDSEYNVKYSEEVWRMLLKFVDFWQTYKPTLLETEVNLFSDKYKIAGTCDLVIELNGKKYLLDIKTSNNLHISYDLQTAAYAKCWDESFEEKIDETGILWLKSSKRGPDKSGKKIQGKGWELYQSSNSIDYNFSYFEKVYDIFKFLNPNHKPVLEKIPIKIVK